MGYAIMRTAKLKKSSDLVDRYNHDMRIYNVRNADPLLASENEMLVDQLYGRSYEDIYQDTIRELQMRGAMGTVRQDAVKGIDIYLGFSHEDADGMDIQEWAKENVKWLREQFNPPERQITYTDKDGNEVIEEIDNVKSVVLHMDESTPHIHAFVVPIDEKGRLNAKSYTAGRGIFQEMQSSYARAMEKFGLRRGEEHAVTTHEQQSEYYRRLLHAVEDTLPPPMPGESLEEYYARAEEAYKNLNVHHNDELVKQKRENNQIQSEVYKERRELNLEREVFQKEKEDFIKETAGIQRENKKMAELLGEPELNPRAMRRARRHLTEREQFEKAVADYPDREYANALSKSYHEMIEWQQTRERQEREKGFAESSRER